MRTSLTLNDRTSLPFSQCYKQLKRDFIRKNQLFVDLEFPPTNSSLFLDIDRSADIVWKRPGEIVEDPKLFVEGASPNDVTQGILGNCWFVSACSALTHNDALLQKVIPEPQEQEWADDKPYCGIFLFRFWRFGYWIDIVIDDLLPTKDGKLLFARSKTPNEFWSALLEKAFAKLYGCYENLVGGQLSDALQDVSGGVAETISVPKFLAENPSEKRSIQLFRTLQTAFDQQALIVAAIAARNKEDIEKTLDCGLVKGHAYAVTAVRYIDVHRKPLIRTKSGAQSTEAFFPSVERQMIIRLQNPWGEKEWNGSWSDGSVEWEQVTDAQKAELGITVDEDGEFWMPWDEFVKYFTDISVCQLFNTIAAESTTVRYNEYVLFDRWATNGVKSGAPRDRAGGCQNFSATFCFNPQFRFDVTEEDGEVMIALTQKDSQPGCSKQREPFVTIGLHVMMVERNRRCRIHQPINPVSTSDYASTRSVYFHLRGLKRGRYIVMPTTYAPREQADFMLRLYSPQRISPMLLARDSPKSSPLNCGQVNSVTRIRVVESHLGVADKDSAMFCTVVSDSEKARTSSVSASSHLRFDQLFVFHRNALRQTYTFELWEERSQKKKRVGRCSYTAVTDNDTVLCELDLRSAQPGNKSFVGRLVVEVSSYDDPMYL
ncbi:calpain-5 [Aphelenchoides avenae]|nr:calpain-5 [Aphelenchus avenae]